MALSTRLLLLYMRLLRAAPVTYGITSPIKDKSSVIDKLDEKKARLAEIKEACSLFIFAKTGTEKLEVDDAYALAPSEDPPSLLEESVPPCLSFRQFRR